MENLHLIIDKNSVLKVLNHSFDYVTNKEICAGLSVKLYNNDKIIYTKNHGNIELDKDTRIPVGSISKLLILYVLLKMQIEKKVDLENKISKYLKWLKHTELGSKKVFKLLNHSTGLSRDGLWGMGINNDYPEESELKNYLKSDPRLRETDWAYSNLGFELARMIIETVSENKYIDYLNQNLITEIGLSKIQTSNSKRVRCFGKLDKGDLKRTFTKHERVKALVGSLGWEPALDEPYKLLSKITKSFQYEITDLKFFVSRYPEPDWILGLSNWKVADEEVYGHQGDGHGFAAKVSTTKNNKFGIMPFSNVTGFPVHQLTNSIFSAMSIYDRCRLQDSHTCSVKIYGNRIMDLVGIHTNEQIVFLREKTSDFFSNPIIAKKEKNGKFKVIMGAKTSFYGEYIKIEAKKIFIGPYMFNLLEEL